MRSRKVGAWVGPIVGFFGPDDARWITGETVRVDGGAEL